MLKSSTRRTIIEKSDDLFYQNGFEATSFGDIASSIGISRGNFYHHFRTKDDILDAVISLRLERTQKMLDDWANGSNNPRDRILSFIQMLIVNRENIMAFGCPVGTLCSELAKLNHIAKPRAAEIMDLFRRWLDRHFRALGAGERSDALALHLLTWSQGVSAMATALPDEDYIYREVANIEGWLDAVPETFPQKRTEP